MHMSAVANRKLVANGATYMAQANKPWATIHAVRRSGLYLLNSSTNAARLCGGRGVKLSSSGLRITKGNSQEPKAVMQE